MNTIDVRNKAMDALNDWLGKLDIGDPLIARVEDTISQIDIKLLRRTCNDSTM